MEKVSHDHNLKNFQVHIKKKFKKQTKASGAWESSGSPEQQGTTALQKSREQRLSRRAGSPSSGSVERAQKNQRMKYVWKRKRKRNGGNRRRVSHGNWRECVWKKWRLNVCGHFVGLVAGKEL